MSKSAWDIFFLLVGCVLWGTSPLFAKLIQLSPGAIIFARSLLSAGALVALGFIFKDAFKVKSKKDANLIVAISILMTLHLVTYYESIQASTVAVAIIALFSYPAFTIGFDVWINKKKFEWIEALCSGLILVGIIIVAGDNDISGNLFRGVFFGVSSAICFALRNVLLKKINRRYRPRPLMLFQFAIGGVLLFPFYVTDLHGMNQMDLVYLIIVSIVVGIFAHTFVIKSMDTVSATTVGIVSASQMIMAPFFSWIVFQEIPTKGIWLGGTLVSLAVITQVIREARKV